ncbi:MAG: hypothetical protein ABIG60_02330 [Patescibacteria group bacterium]
MQFSEYLNLIEKKSQSIISIIIIFLIVGVIITFVQPIQFGAESKLLIVQSFPLGTDPYAVSRSNEQLSNVLAKVVSSNSFYNDVINSGYNINQAYFSNSKNEIKEMNKWRQTVSVKALNDSGIIAVNVYHTDKGQLEQISKAVNYVMQTKHKNYHGAGDNVVVKVIDKPIISVYPVKPNIMLNLILALLLGLVTSLIYIYLLPEDKYSIRLWPKRNKNIHQEINENSDWDSMQNLLNAKQEQFKKEQENFNTYQNKEVSHNPEQMNYQEYVSNGNIHNVIR